MIEKKTLGRLLAGAVFVAGALLVGTSFHEAPAARIARQAVRDHERALLEARPHAPTGVRDVRESGGAPAPPPRSATSSTWPRGQVALLTIPALSVQAPVLAVGPVGGALSIPADVHEVGWDDQSSPPGTSGVTLLAGHVNWVGQGEGALGQIGALVPGDVIILDWGGVTTTWRVQADPMEAPNTEIHPGLFTRSGTPTLALVTCGGPFTETASGGSYADNVIVLAHRTG